MLFCSQKGSASRGGLHSGEGGLHPGEGGLPRVGGLHPGGWADPPNLWILQDTVIERAVRILLECILV